MQNALGITIHGGWPSERWFGCFVNNHPIGPWSATSLCLQVQALTRVAGCRTAKVSAIRINPATDQPWGPDFPGIRLEDIVEVQWRLLAALGVSHLRAVIGPSYGGWQALQWALNYPDMVDAIGALVSGFTHPPGVNKASQRTKFEARPEWHGGRYYEHGRMFDALFSMRLQTLQSYGLEKLYVDRIPDPQKRREAMETSCRVWAEQFDPNSLVTLAGAAEHFDVRQRAQEIRARVLLIQCTTDPIFPPTEETKRVLATVRAPTRYIELDSKYGHMASGVEWPRWQSEMKWLLSS